ncbi:MAG: tail fiber domain-containing protein, partial [Saprospiraceae bacterium]
GISSSSLSGPGAVFTSVSGPSLITSGGNVGIGISNPTHLFEVNGGIFTKTINATISTGYAATFKSLNGPAVLIDQVEGWSGIRYSYGNALWKTAIDYDSDFAFGYNGNYTAWILKTDGSFHNSSDRALKKDIQPFSNVLSKLMNLQAYTYHMKSAPDDSPISVGFMAQEVEKEFPQLVVTKNGYRSICYDHFAVLSVQAIKEQQVEIEDLKKQISELKEMVTALVKK